MDYQSLSFPLNVYASLLQLDNQPVEYLHFGLFQSTDENVYVAQKHSTEKILQHIPKAPGRVLEIGIGLGTMQKILHEQGYQPQGLTPDQAQYHIALNNIGSKANIQCIAFEDFNTEKSFNTIISQESAQYIDILNLLPKVTSLLKINGYFILIDEVSLRPDQVAHEALHNPEHLAYLAKNLGLELIYEEELGNYAQHTMEYLQARLAGHRSMILSIIDNNEQKLIELEKSIDHYIERYRQQQYGYRLMVFTKPRQTLNTIHYLNQSHLAEFQQLFTHCFQISISLNLWRWKYQQEKAHSIGYWKETKLIGHYGGFSRDILYFGQQQQALQIGDTMVLPAEQGRLTKNGIFHQLARVFLQRFIGYGAPYILGFGFPNARVMKLAERLGLYKSAGKFTRLSWPTQAIKAHPLYKLRTVSDNDSGAIDMLWETMANDTKNFIIGVRNGQRIQYRYQQHPENNYLVLKLCQRFSNKLIAIIVLKEQIVKKKSCYQLIDFICSLKHISLVLRSSIRFAWQQNHAELCTLISEAMKPYFQSYTYVEEDPQICIPHCSCTPGPALQAVRNHWWLMAGDSDFM